MSVCCSGWPVGSASATGCLLSHDVMSKRNAASTAAQDLAGFCSLLCITPSVTLHTAGTHSVLFYSADGDSSVLLSMPPKFDVWHPPGFNNVLLESGLSVICVRSENFLRKELFWYWELLNSSTCNKVNIAEKIKGRRNGHKHLG